MHELALLLPAAGGLAVAGRWARWKLRTLRAPFGLGDKAPDFRGAPAADGRRYSLADFAGSRALVVVFTSNRCPGVKAYDARLKALHDAFAPRGVAFVAVNPISVALHPAETLDGMARAVRERGLPYAHLKDEDQSIARAYGAVATPRAFLFDARMRLRYHGRVDNAFVPARVTERFLHDALEDVLAGRRVRTAQTAPLGCVIDWADAPRRKGEPWWRAAHEKATLKWAQPDSNR